MEEFITQLGMNFTMWDGYKYVCTDISKPVLKGLEKKEEYKRLSNCFPFKAQKHAEGRPLARAVA
jgi:hypothetical protein